MKKPNNSIDITTMFRSLKINTTKMLINNFKRTTNDVFASSVEDPPRRLCENLRSLAFDNFGGCLTCASADPVEFLFRFSIPLASKSFFPNSFFNDPRRV